ncbi:HpcH/HpaI aldolase/citrate lyase family protein [Sulfurimonas sp. SAG-AH-194-I05]|nr:HpcH/HpaI aldolase/citrate lyase family protein [Sulfurimonas sp. SAG-AH-194-I05]MDF1875157.1 HpcH/HpaI aldolase/citrate lyase family protein [Sulfurimonas sp. SAG-AH-194-I05]
MERINYIKLGGTLFIPATHKDLQEVVNGGKYPNLKSVVVDTEDSISDYELPHALRCIKGMLNALEQTSLLVFLRPRNPKILKELLACVHVDRIDGFVLPKFSLENADTYLKILKHKSYSFMPSIEGSELFDEKKLLSLKDKLLPYKSKIVLIRFGLEDMLKQLKMRRTCLDSIFDYSVTNAVLGKFIMIFKVAGFEISGGVYPCFEDLYGFRKDARRDLKEGLFSKTIIHPNQIDIINDLYQVREKDYKEALEILASDKPVFNQNSRMAETTTMNPHAKSIVDRATFYKFS